jgi:hypothetical protein
MKRIREVHKASLWREHMAGLSRGRSLPGMWEDQTDVEFTSTPSTSGWMLQPFQVEVGWAVDVLRLLPRQLA